MRYVKRNPRYNLSIMYASYQSLRVGDRALRQLICEIPSAEASEKQSPQTGSQAFIQKH